VTTGMGLEMLSTSYQSSTHDSVHLNCNLLSLAKLTLLYSVLKVQQKQKNVMEMQL